MKEQKKYLREKAELKSAMTDCANKLTICDQHVRLIAEVLDRANAIPNDKLAQLNIIQTYLSTIPYDHDEAASGKTDLEHYTMKQAIDLNKLICDEKGKLTLFMSEELKDFNEDDVRWIYFKVFTKDLSKELSPHAMTVARIDGKIWTMSLASNPIGAANHSGVAAQQVAVENSAVYSPGTMLGLSKSSTAFYCVSGHLESVYFIPQFALNSVQAGNFNSEKPTASLSNVPAEAKVSVAESSFISLETLKRYNVLPLILQAIEQSYQMQEAEQAQRPPPSPQIQPTPSQC